MTQQNTTLVPLCREHLKLREIVAGTCDFAVDLSKAESFFSSDVDVLEIANKLYNIEIKADNNPFVIVQEPAMTDGMYYIRKVLNDEGKRCIELLDGGWVVDKETMAEDLSATIDFYEDMMKNGSLKQDLAVMVIANKDDRLRDVRSNITLYRMASEKKKERDGDYFVAPKD